MEFAFAPLLDLGPDRVVTSVAAHGVAPIRTAGTSLANPTVSSERSDCVIKVTVVRRFLEKYQVVGSGDVVRLPLDAESTPSSRLDSSGVVVFRFQMVTNFSEGRQLLPASDERARSADSVAFACHLHILDDGPSTSLVIVQIHQLAAVILASSLHAHFALTDVNEILGKFVSIVDVISTSTPNPFLPEIFGSSGLGTTTGSQLAVSATARDAVNDTGGSHRVGKCSFFRWYG